MSKTNDIEVNLPINLPSSLESKRAKFENLFLNAQNRLNTFAAINGWSTKPFIDRAEIYNSHSEFVKTVAKLLNTEPSIFPKQFSACLENRVFIAVSPEVYSEIYSEGNEPNSYEKLITHEMAHRLHVTILNGNEEAMGPVWFYEGFAIHAANQFESTKPFLSDNEIWEIIQAANRGSYIKYAPVMDYLLKKVPLDVLVRKASDGDFIEWLKKTFNR